MKDGMAVYGFSRRHGRAVVRRGFLLGGSAMIGLSMSLSLGFKTTAAAGDLPLRRFRFRLARHFSPSVTAWLAGRM